MYDMKRLNEIIRECSADSVRSEQRNDQQNNFLKKFHQWEHLCVHHLSGQKCRAVLLTIELILVFSLQRLLRSWRMNGFTCG